MPCSSVTRLTASATFWLSLAAMALPLMMRAVIVPTYRARDLRLLAGASDDRLPSRAPDSPHLAADSERATLTDESLYQSVEMTMAPTMPPPSQTKVQPRESQSCHKSTCDADKIPITFGPSLQNCHSYQVLRQSHLKG
jgi:hypothetical protein